ncbi:hypothetical protein ACQKQA_25170, partial [Pseudomonas sp. NPDC089530]
MPEHFTDHQGFRAAQQFRTYADQAIGPWAGFTIGWLYWWFWVLVIPIE